MLMKLCWSFAKAETEAHGKFPIYNTRNKYSASQNQGWGLFNQLPSVPLFSQSFSTGKTQVAYWISPFIFGMHHRSSAAMTPDKCECDSTYFVRSKLLLTGKLKNGVLTSPPQHYKVLVFTNRFKYLDSGLKARTDCQAMDIICSNIDI